MPFPIAHTLTGLMINNLAPRIPRKPLYMEILMVVFLANLPDLDFIPVFILQSVKWHRTFTHSFLFALLASMLATYIFWGSWQWKRWLVYLSILLSHPILDSLTCPLISTNGVMFFWPFSMTRFRFGLINHHYAGWGELPLFQLIKMLCYISFVEISVCLPLFFITLGIRYLRDKHFTIPSVEPDQSS